jgi:hypothetical protein
MAILNYLTTTHFDSGPWACWPGRSIGSASSARS